MQAHNVYLEKEAVATGGWTRDTGGSGEGYGQLPVQVNKNMITKNSILCPMICIVQYHCFPGAQKHSQTVWVDVA